MTSARPPRLAPGFTLIEVLVAMTIVLTTALGTARLFGAAIKSTAGARYQTSTTVLATQKLEQLRALTFMFDQSGNAVSDTATDLSVEPPVGGGGGLSPSPANALAVNTPGYVDYLDRRGNWVGNGPAVPAAALYIRRWDVAPLAADPNDSRLLQVLVTTVHRDRQAAPAGARVRLQDDALVATVKTRKAS